MPKEVPEDVEEHLSSYDDTTLMDLISKSIFSGFLTDTGLGISVTFRHAMGGHYEIIISDDELLEYLVDNV